MQSETGILIRILVKVAIRAKAETLSGPLLKEKEYLLKCVLYEDIDLTYRGSRSILRPNIRFFTKYRKLIQILLTRYVLRNVLYTYSPKDIWRTNSHRYI